VAAPAVEVTAPVELVIETLGDPRDGWAGRGIRSAFGWPGVGHDALWMTDHRRLEGDPAAVRRPLRRAGAELEGGQLPRFAGGRVEHEDLAHVSLLAGEGDAAPVRSPFRRVVLRSRGQLDDGGVLVGPAQVDLASVVDCVAVGPAHDVGNPLAGRIDAGVVDPAEVVDVVGCKGGHRH